MKPHRNAAAPDVSDTEGGTDQPGMAINPKCSSFCNDRYAGKCPVACSPASCECHPLVRRWAS